MTAIKNGMKTALRTPGKTLLFSLILTALAVLICLSFCVFSAVRNYIRDCDEYYHTVVDMEFIGKEYPEGYAYDETMASVIREHQSEIDALRHSDAVIRFEPVTHALAGIEGLKRSDRFVYDPDAAVFYIYVLGYDENSGSFLASVNDVLYCREDFKGKLIMMRTASMNIDERQSLDLGETYLICGHFFQSLTSYSAFFAEPLTYLRGNDAVTVPECVHTDELTPELLSDYEELAESIRVCNDCCTLQVTASADDLVPFHQQELTLSEGRLFEQREYDEAAKVCIVSNRIAYALDLSEGDRITLSMLTAEGNLFGGKLERSASEQYTVVGIYNRNDNYPACVFIPDASAADAPLIASNGFWLGVFRVKNADITEFLIEASKLEQYGFRFTAYDQGYSTVVEPMSELMLISIIFLAICVALTVGALSLQCHIFITRQREAARTMIAMGSGRAHIGLYFLSAAALLSIPAAIVGCIVGKLMENTVFDILERFAAQFAEQDLRFSSSRVTLVRTLTFSPRVSSVIYIAAGTVLLLAVFLFTLLFSQGVMKDRAVRKKHSRAPRTLKRVRCSTKLSGKLKYAVLSIRRNPVRTVAVLLLCLLVSLFFARLTLSLDGYRTQLDAVRENTVLKGRATDYFGKQINELVVYRRTYDSLSESDVLSGITVSRDMGHLRFSGVSVTADGEVQDIPAPNIPTTSFGIETMLGQMYFEPGMIMTTSVRNSTVFYFSEPTHMVWLDGFNEERFFDEPDYCVMPEQLMARDGISLGDTAVFILSYDNWLSAIELKVVGSYLTSTGDETILVPLDLQDESPYLQNKGFDSLTFTLDDVSKLDALRDALEKAGFSPVRTSDGPRYYAVIDDEMYLETTHSMERQIKYVTVLYNSLYVLTGIIGFVLAWLLVSSRGKEIAVMRALGTRPFEIVAIFFAEQMLLCGAGLGIGLLIEKLFGHTIGPQLKMLVLLFFAVWLVSSLICLLVSVTKQAYAALAEPE